MNPQFSTYAVESSASQVFGSFTAVNESAPPVFEQVYQEQIAADPRSFDRTQQRTVENSVHVPIPQFQEQSVESVQKTPQGRLPERIEEPVENTPIPQSICYSALAPVIEDIHLRLRTSRQHQQRPTHCALRRYLRRSRDVLPAELKIGDLGFNMFGRSREVIRIGTGLHFIGQNRVLYPWEKRGRFESGSWMRRNDFTSNEHDAKRRRLLYEVAEPTSISPTASIC